MLQYLRVILADGMVLHPCVFSYGRLVREAFDTNVLMLLLTCFDSTCGLTDVHLPTGARYFVDVCLLLHKEGVLDLSEERMEGGSKLEHCSDVEILTHTSEILTHTSDPHTQTIYVRVGGGLMHGIYCTSSLSPVI